MSFANTVSPSLEAGRRFHARRRIDGLAYVEFSPDNGAILIDVSEGGLGFQSVMPVTMDQALLFKFKLPATTSPIEGFAEVAWVNESGKGGGLRFVTLSADACTQIREWTGVLAAPDARPRPAAIADSKPAPERPAEHVASVSEQESTFSETNQGEEAAPQLAEELTPAESAQITGAGLDADPPSPSASPAAASEQVQVQQDAVTEEAAIPEFTMEATPASDAPSMPATKVEWAPPAAARSEVVEAAFSRSTPRGSGAAKTNTAAAANPAKSLRVPAPDEKTLAAKKVPKKQPPLKTESRIPTAYRKDPAVQGFFERQPQRPAPPIWPSESVPGAQFEDDELNPTPTLASQAIKIGIGAAVGASLVLALVAIVPSLRTRVQATANAKASGPILPGAGGFQVEVADLNNRRWILRSGGDANSPFSDAPSRRDNQSASSSRGESKSSRVVDDTEESSDKPSAPQSKLRKPAELALSRPRTNSPGVASAQLAAPSIFDGITPPIGSVTDRLAGGGPEVPGIVQPDAQAGLRTSSLEAAVLDKRVAPVYPSLALAGHVVGDVLVNATIGTDGVPRDLKVIRGDQRLVPAALNAIAQWRYRPATLGGTPIETQIVITVAFQLK